MLYISLFIYSTFQILLRGGHAINILQYIPDDLEKQYGTFSDELRVEMLEESKKMFYFGYDNYMKYAFPKDELNPIDCKGRGPDYDNPSNININDVLGDYCLTLIDSLDTLIVLQNWTEFRRAVQLVIHNVSFNNNNTIQVFEANIRLLGGLISAHLLLEDASLPLFSDQEWYDGELLSIAHDLASRLIPAFQNTKTGLPYPRINLKSGVPSDCTNETCTAGAGSLLLEFGTLSRLLGDPVYEAAARRANRALWSLRSEKTGLLGNVVDIQSGKWISKLSGLGAGIDSFFEYLLKSYILFGQEEDFRMFNESYTLINQYLRRGRPHCNKGNGEHPLYVNVDMGSGNTQTAWIDSLQAAFAGVQVLYGDLQEAICAHALYYIIWERYGALPERFNWQKRQPDVFFYPLRPELIESTYLLYQATRNPFYLHVGRSIILSLNTHTKAECGYATIHNVVDKSLEDRMESFFLSETVKYLILLFDEDNHFNKYSSDYMFTTEGHILPMKANRHLFRSKPWQEEGAKEEENLRSQENTSQVKCHSISEEQRWLLPLKSRYVAQLQAHIGF